MIEVFYVRFQVVCCHLDIYIEGLQWVVGLNRYRGSGAPL